ncbi:MAG: hypothetical protein K2Q24_13685 [Chitinophagaceae bacterium]|nr:hypothetical protein [Chitinophagaceae bacterium]
MRFLQKWSLVAIINFTVLAAVGVILRYKILFPLPFFDQKHLLHAHSHFAFAGWVSLVLFIGIIHLIQPTEKQKKQLNMILHLQLWSSYGMLFTFPLMGYAAPSIAFSTISILVSFVFAFVVFKLMANSRHLTNEKKWLYAALCWNMLSSLGTFTLAYLMMQKSVQQDFYFGAIYFYLHFQYNGWFLFAIAFLFTASIKQWLTPALQQQVKRGFFLLIITAVPALFLSMMWMRLPRWMLLAADAAALIQLVAAGFLIKMILQIRKQLQLPTQVKWLWLIACAAFVLKIILQAFSAIPELNTYAFGIRAIVIAFLHLVLLLFVSFFLLGFLIQHQLITVEKKQSKTGLWLFACAAISNEVLLMLQGIAAMQSTNIPYNGYLLLAVAVAMFGGLLLLCIGQKKQHIAPVTT